MLIQKLVLAALATPDQNSRRQLCQNQFLNHVQYRKKIYLQMIMHFEHMKVMSNDIFSRTKQFIKQLNPKQILGIALFVAGLYLLISSIYTIRQMCSDSDSSSGFLGIASFFNPLIGLASLADSDSAEFDITPLIGGIILTITGAVLVIIQSMKKRLHK
jgi:hypothetical protein